MSFQIDKIAMVQSIKGHCKRLGKSITTLEADLGWSLGSISRWKGDTWPTLLKLVLLCDALGLDSIDQLLGIAPPVAGSGVTSPPDYLAGLLRLTQQKKITWQYFTGIEPYASTTHDLLAKIKADMGHEKQHCYVASQKELEGYHILVVSFEPEGEDGEMAPDIRIYQLGGIHDAPVLYDTEQHRLVELLAEAAPDMHLYWSERRAKRLNQNAIYLSDTTA